MTRSLELKYPRLTEVQIRSVFCAPGGRAIELQRVSEPKTLDRGLIPIPGSLPAIRGVSDTQALKTNSATTLSDTTPSINSAGTVVASCRPTEVSAPQPVCVTVLTVARIG
jgi:hypothetical protein